MSPRAGLDCNIITSTAADMADEIGLDQISLAAIAERLGVKTPSLYNHIKGLSDLKRNMAVFGINELSLRIARAAIGKSKDDALLATIKAYREFAEERPGLYEATIRSADQNYPARQNAVDNLMEILMRINEPYGLSRENSIHQIRALRSMVHGFLGLKAAGTFGNRSIDPEITFQRMINNFLQGMHTLSQSSNDPDIIDQTVTAIGD